MSDYKNNNNGDGDGDGSEKETEQQHEEGHDDEEMAVSSSSTPGSTVRKSKKRNISYSSNTSLGMDSSSHHVAATMAMTRAETRVVNRWKLLLVFVLLVSMIGVGLAVYFFTAKSERMDFQVQFEDDAHKVLEALGGSLDLTLKAVDALAVSMVSFAQYADQKWPFVTIPDFEVRTSKIRSLSKAVYLNIYPLVLEENKEAWENYTATNNGWVDESMRIQEKDFQTYHGPRPLPNKGDYEVFNFIHGEDQLDETGEGTKRPGPYLPTWQSSPVIPTSYPPYNWDLLSALETSSADAMLKTKRAVISEAYMIPDYSDEDQLAETQANADWFADFLGPNKDPMEPVSDIYYPILDSMRDSVHVDMHPVSMHEETATTAMTNNTANNIVGILSLSIYWRDTLEQILPPGSNGIVVVFENPCNPSFTYQIDGPNATYLGIGDLHDERYDHLVQSSKLQKSLHGDHDHDHVYTGIHVHEEFCPFTIQIYPSADMENDYMSNQPIVFSVAAILIFAVTCTVFIMYDRWVERRQVKVLGSALEATFNVGLLEEMVCERTLKLESSNLRLEQANVQLEQANAQVLLASAAQLRTFASMSHEIRTPLNCIVGLSSILAEDVDLNAKQRESIKMIIHSGELLRNVVNDVLDYSKLESGNLPIEMQCISLQETLNTVAHSIGSNDAILASKPTLRLVTHYDANVPHYDANVPEFLVSDGRRLQQILYNLLGNAMKFSKDGGVVELGVSIIHANDNTHAGTNTSGDDKSFSMDETSSSEKVIHLKRQSTAAPPEQAVPTKHSNSSIIGRRIRFMVKDYGKGIAAKDFEKIFQPFSQASQETSNTYGGNGLGLSITARLVEALGGTISIDSRVGEWSKFTVNLPIRQEENSVNNDNILEQNGPATATVKDCNTTLVDMGYLSSRLENATVCLVGPVQHLEQVTNIFCEYKVAFAHFDNGEELEAYISANSKRVDSDRGAGQEAQSSQQEHETRAFICLVQEDLVGKNMRSMLAKFASKTILLTFGPKHSLVGVEGHYRSLEQILPSVLMKDLGDYYHREASSKEVTEAFVEREQGSEGKTSSSCSSSHNNDTDTACTAASSSSSSDRHHHATKTSLPIENGQGAQEGTERSSWADPAPANVATVAATSPPSSFDHLRILIAEDNLVNQKVLGRILDRLGVKNVEIVDNGQKAVDREAANPYDIIFMDVQMPVMDGVQACKLIRSRHHHRGRDPNHDSEHHALASVVFVTAQVSLSCEAEYFQAGAYDFLPKPCSMNGVRNCLQKYVETHKQSSRSLTQHHMMVVMPDACDLVHC